MHKEIPTLPKCDNCQSFFNPGWLKSGFAVRLNRLTFCSKGCMETFGKKYAKELRQTINQPQLACAE